MILQSVLIVFLLFVITSPTTSGLEYGENLVEDPIVARKWVEAAAEFDEIVFPQKKYIIKFLNKTSDLPLSPKCASSLIALSTGLREKKFWAYQYLDSSARGRSGLANGFISDLGDFDQCLNILEDGHDFRGAYCLVNLKFPLTKQPDRAFLRVSMTLLLVHLMNVLFPHSFSTYFVDDEIESQRNRLEGHHLRVLRQLHGTVLL